MDFIPCIECGKKAKWSYMPSDENFCDLHVPRGCSCNQDESGKEELDDQDRKMPCVEFNEIIDEAHDDVEIVKDAWEVYYKYNPDEEPMKDYEELEEQFAPPIRKKNRRTRIKDDQANRSRGPYNGSGYRGGNSKPKGKKKRVDKHIDF